MMKKIIFTFACSIISIFAFSQSFQSVEEVDETCATALGFASDYEAEKAVDDILDEVGLFRNFVIQECPNINNAVAVSLKNKEGQTERFILYDNDFFEKIGKGDDYAAIFILAHEIGHHLNGHSLNNQGSNHQFELEADYFAGRVLAQMGYSLDQTLTALNAITYEKATRTHPAKADRIAMATKGYGKVRGKEQVLADISEKTEVTEQEVAITEKEEEYEKASSVFEKGEMAFAAKDYGQSHTYFERAANEGIADAYYYLSLQYTLALGVEPDPEESFRLAKKGYEMGSIPATFWMGLFMQRGNGTVPDTAAAERYLKKSYLLNWFQDRYEKRKEAQDSYALAYFYNYGYGGAKVDSYKTIDLMKQAADAGFEPAMKQMIEIYLANNDLKSAVPYLEELPNDPEAKSYLAYYYLLVADEAERDEARGARLLEEVVASDPDNVDARATLAAYYMGVDETKAVALLEEVLARDPGNVAATTTLLTYYMGVDESKGIALCEELLAKDSQNMVAINIAGNHYLSKGIALYQAGGKSNSSAGAQWVKKAAEIGYADAQVYLARKYAYGEGVEPNKESAVFWYQKAAEQGVAEAQALLGAYYEDGTGVQKDEGQAFHWYQKAAEQGHDYGQYKLAGAYEKGTGTPVDLEQALHWYREAKASGYACDKEINKLERKVR